MRVELPEGSRSLASLELMPHEEGPPRPAAAGGGGGNRNFRSPASRDRRGLGSPSVSHRGNEIICTSIVCLNCLDSGYYTYAWLAPKIPPRNRSSDRPFPAILTSLSNTFTRWRESASAR